MRCKIKTLNNQFQLFKTRRFLPLFVTQFLGALNDNLFKQGLLIIVVSQVVLVAGNSADFFTNLAAGLFILPYFLFSTTAGQLADSYDKAMLIRRIKLAEMLIMTVGAYSLYSLDLNLMLMVLFLLGLQSTFFGPIKYAIIPQHLEPSELLAGNAQVGMGTFVSILLGTLIGGWLVTMPSGRLLLGVATVSVATIGWLSSTAIPAAPPYDSAPPSWNPLRDSFKNFVMARQNKTVFYCVLSISWFWLFGSCFLTQVPNFAVKNLQGEPLLSSILIAAFIIGVAIGCLLCTNLSGKRVEPGIIPLGAFGLSLFSVDLYQSFNTYADTVGRESLISIMTFLQMTSGLHILVDLILIGAFGGLYIVPLYAMIQERTESGKRARMIALNNIINALFMVLGSVLGIICLAVIGWSIPEFFLFMALLNAVFSCLIFSLVPEFFERFKLWLKPSIFALKRFFFGRT